MLYETNFDFFSPDLVSLLEFIPQFTIICIHCLQSLSLLKLRINNKLYSKTLFLSFQSIRSYINLLLIVTLVKYVVYTVNKERLI